MSTPCASLSLNYWLDLPIEDTPQNYIDYNALIRADDDFLCFESLFGDTDEL